MGQFRQVPKKWLVLFFWILISKLSIAALYLRSLLLRSGGCRGQTGSGCGYRLLLCLHLCDYLLQSLILHEPLLELCSELLCLCGVCRVGGVCVGGGR